ncbi:phage tail-collar fiber domain-containing protein [Pseudomonas plecoglossicida]|uniref:phage tail-collar fiber domain-containing protein n=1 Tax=Pseudomonas plecoglossicida TaxID=70775 RepID=UPI0021596FFE|nr:phage tail protein [Pseudomonas plecoglossicida]
MVDQNTQFYAILTNVGAAKQANADALGIAWKITQMGLGDANGTDPTPNATQTALLNEWRRAPLNQLKVDDKDASIIVAEQVIPAEVGGHWIREIGLYDADGDLVAVANCAPTYKPLLNQGSGRTQVVRMSLVVSSASNVQLKIDPSVVLATREFVTEELARQDFKHSVLVATTAAITLSGLQAVDGVFLTAGARVLVKNQAAGKDNGLYLAAVGGWTRCSDADTNAKVTPGLLVLVERGTANGDSAWQLVTDAPIVLGVTALSFEMAFGRTGVAADTYRSVTVDKYGRVVSATNPTTVAGYGLTDVYTKAELDTALAAKAPLASPKFTGLPEVPTPGASDNSQRIANTAFVKAALEALVAAAPGALDTLNELAAAIGNDPNFAATITNSLAGKAPLASPKFTGLPEAPTPALTASDALLATTQFVQLLLAATGWGALGPATTVMPAGTDLNNMIVPGSYGQTANNRATLALNYPEPLAGTLLVQAAGPNLITQTYSVRGPTNRKWDRNLYAGVWSTWTEETQVDSPTLRGEPKAPTAPVGTNSTVLATTAHVRLMLNQYGLGSGNGGVVPATQDEIAALPSGNYYYSSAITPYPYLAFVQRMAYAGNRGFEVANIPYTTRFFGRPSNNDGSWQAPVELANLSSPAFLGLPTAPTPAKGANNKLIATTEFVQAALAALLDSAPSTLDTLAELAASLANDPNFATTMTNALAGKAAKATTLGGYGILDGLVVKANYVSQQQPVLAAPAAGTTASETALVIREAMEVGAAQSSDGHAPGIGFLWSARKAGRLIMDAAGLLKWNGVPLLTGAIATQAEVDTGSSDVNVVTPAKMRFGFTFIKGGGGDSNAIKFPSWLGGLMLQWGVHVANAADTETTVTFPLAFSIVPGLSSTFMHDGVMTQSSVTSQVRGLSVNGFQSRREDIGATSSFTGTAYIRWIAVGY